jgi:hypothetical protein
VLVVVVVVEMVLLLWLASSFKWFKCKWDRSSLLCFLKTLLYCLSIQKEIQVNLLFNLIERVSYCPNIQEQCNAISNQQVKQGSNAWHEWPMAHGRVDLMDHEPVAAWRTLHNIEIKTIHKNYVSLYLYY